jgi:alpha-amylase
MGMVMPANDEMRNFIKDGNGILCCYNMFPTQFKNINDMTGYLPSVKEMGFNAVWINPIQQSGNVDGLSKRDKTNGVRAGNLVTRSLYAMKDKDMISPYFSVASADASPEQAASQNEQALKNFTKTARDNGLVPMFDLVLNHVSSDSKHIEEHPEWFQEKAHPEFKDARAFNYSDPKTMDDIIEQFWKPYIHKYMVDYGFDGVRVDAVGYLHPELRHKIYKLIYDIAAENNKPKPVILDEALFSGQPVEAVVENLLLPDVGPTHITRSTYYAHRDNYGGLPNWYKHEEGVKAQVVFLNKNKKLREGAKGGCIAFSGNHDHNSLAMTIVEEMAHERLEKNEKMSQKLHEVQEGGNGHYDEALQSTFLYSFVKDIENEMVAGNQSVISEVERRMRDKIAMCALTASGGWYALSGDESGDLLAKPVFRRAHALDQTYYPQRTHIFFDKAHKHYHKAMSALTAMAERNIINEKAGRVYSELSVNHEAQKRLLVPYLETLQHQINCGDKVVCESFKKELAKADETIDFTDEAYIDVPRTAENGWNGTHNMRPFMTSINRILTDLPASKFEFWSELISLPSKPELAIVVRKNGFGLEADTDIAIVNLTPEKKVELKDSDIEGIALHFQQRVIAESDRHDGNSDYGLAYTSVMSCIKSGRIHVDETINASFRQKSPLVSYSLFKPVTEHVDMKKVKEVSAKQSMAVESPSLETPNKDKPNQFEPVGVKTSRS